jgi:hypothetical protein
LGDVPIRIWTLSGYRLDWKEANFLSLTPGANALKQRPKVIPARNVRVRTDGKTYISRHCSKKFFEEPYFEVLYTVPTGNYATIKLEKIQHIP